jgi:hypothetical protein
LADCLQIAYEFRYDTQIFFVAAEVRADIHLDHHENHHQNYLVVEMEH